MTGARARWKAFYRWLRLARREARKAERDMQVFGSGAVFFGKDGEVRHIPIDEIQA